MVLATLVELVLWFENPPMELGLVGTKNFRDKPKKSKRTPLLVAIIECGFSQLTLSAMNWAAYQFVSSTVIAISSSVIYADMCL